MKAIDVNSKKNSIKSIMLGMAFAAICMLANAQDVTEHTITI